MSTSSALHPSTRFARVLALRDAGRFADAEAALAPLLAETPDDLEALALRVHLQLAQGRDGEAEALCDRLQALAPEAGATLRGRARLLLRRGQAQPAAAAARAAVAAEPDREENSLVLASALAADGKLDEAQALADAVIGRRPEAAEAYILRAQVAARRGRHLEAAEACEAALRLKPELPIWTLLGTMRQGAGQLEPAAAAYRRALELNAKDVAALLGLAALERRAGRPDAADALFRQATSLAPDRADAWMAYGVFLQGEGRAADAAVAYERTLALDGSQVAVHLNLATVLAELGFRDRAEASCRRAIALRPDFAAAHFALAGLLQNLQRLPEAEAACRQALALDPAFTRARLGLAAILREQGELAAARAEFDRVMAEQPSLGTFLNARLTLPVVAASEDEILEARAAYAAAIAEAMSLPGPLGQGALTLPASWFHLAYHGLDDRPIMEALDALFAAKAPELSAVSPHIAAWRAPAPGARIKVGFVSQFLGNHTVGRLYQGLIAGLDRARFEVVVVHLPRSQRDELREAIDRSADAVIELPAMPTQQQARLAAEAFDVLFFPDVGMGSASTWLARARLAPVQAVGWGHPDTTGLTSLDYFVSFDRAEPPGAEAHYTERLVRLPRMACSYGPQPAQRVGRAALGLPETGVLYGCLQSLFKLHPQFDAVLAEIVRRDPTGWLVFAEPGHTSWLAALRRRWARFPQIAARAIFQPRRPMAGYLSLVAEMDMLLDPPRFGSGATFYDAMQWGVPTITWPGDFARGRVVAGLYGQMQAGAELIVDRLEDYADRAVGLAADPARREALRATLAEAARRELFADALAVRQLAAFFEAAVAAAGRGETLPPGWSPPQA